LGTGVEQIRTRAECPYFYTYVLNKAYDISELFLGILNVVWHCDTSGQIDNFPDAFFKLVSCMCMLGRIYQNVANKISLKCVNRKHGYQFKDGKVPLISWGAFLGCACRTHGSKGQNALGLGAVLSENGQLQPH
jgi:hypothetical protein